MTGCSKQLAVVIILLFFSTLKSLSQYPQLVDTTFGKKGSTTNDFSERINGFVKKYNSFYTSGVQMNDSGEIFISGSLLNYPVIRKMKTDGTDDINFAGNGLYIVHSGYYFQSSFEDIIKYPDGRLLATGYGIPARSIAAKDNSIQGIFLTRLLSDGKPDLTFGNKGNAFVSIGGQAAFGVKSVIQADGKIICAARFEQSDAGNILNVRKLAIVRLFSNGNVDSSFGINGWAYFNYTQTPEDYDLGLAVQSNGKIIVGDLTTETYSVNYGFGERNAPAIYRLDANGKMDNSFATNGKFFNKLGNLYYHIKSLTIQSDNKILVGGFTRDAANNYKWIVFRLQSNGNIDSTFATNGIFTYTYTTTATAFKRSSVEGLSLNKDGSILVNGYFSDPTKSYLALLQLKGNGILDSSFFQGTDAGHQYVYTYPLNINQFIYTSAFDRDKAGNIILLANHLNSNGYTDAHTIVSLNSLLKLNTTFNGNGRYTFLNNTAYDDSTILNYGTNDFLVNSFVLPDNKILNIGSVINHNEPQGSNVKIGLERLLPNGHLDSTFGINGQVVVNTSYIRPIKKASLFNKGVVVLSNSNNIIKLDIQAGKVDSSFGINGSVIFNDFTSAFEVTSDFEVTDDNKLFVLTYYDLYKLLPNGSRDQSFGSNGRIKFSFNFSDKAVMIKKQKDGKFLIFTDVNNVYRFNADGTPDNSFGYSGKGIANFFQSANIITNTDGNFNPVIKDVAIQDNGKIVILTLKDRTPFATYNNGLGNYYDAFNYRDIELYRLLSNGRIDNSFGSNTNRTKYGAVNFKLPFKEEVPSSMCLFNNKIYIGGYFNNGANWQPGMLIVKENGTYDTTCSFNGIALSGDRNLLEEDNSYVYPLKINITKDSATLLSGTMLNRLADFYTVKLLNDLKLPFTDIDQFTGKKDTTTCNTIQLSWNTSYECNTDSFQVLHSTDGLSFSRIGILKATGNAAASVSYSFWDDAASKGNNFYQLKVYGKNGETQKTAIINLLNGPATISSVDLLDATVSSIDSVINVELKWRSQNEFNVQQFDVQLSTDSINFSTITTIAPRPSTSNIKYYNSTITHLANAKYYFRIIIRESCEQQYSNIISNELSTLRFRIWPNPTYSILKVELPSFNGAELKIYNDIGQLIKSINPSENRIDIDCSALPASSYRIVYYYPGGFETLKFIKIN